MSGIGAEARERGRDGGSTWSRRRLFVLSGLVLLAGSAAGAGDEPSRQVVLGTEWTINSDVLEDARRIFVALPPEGVSQGGTFPVLYVLDGHRQFEIAAASARFLAESGVIPPLLVVGVANDVDRGYYLTPPVDRWLSRSGGADRFLDFLRTELFPWVEGRYPAAPYRILTGASFGGLFTLHAFFTHPETFQAYLAVSPSVHMGEGALVEQAAKRLDLGVPAHRFLFLSLADERNELQWGQEMRSHFDRMVELFDYRSGAAGLRFDHRDYPDETHASTKLVALVDGLRSLFRHWPVPAHHSDAGWEGLERHFEELSEELGYTVTVPELALLELGYEALGADRTAEAVEIFRSAVRRYPGSPNSWDSLAEGLEKAGEWSAALEAMDRAVDTAGRADDSSPERYRQRREAMEGRIVARKEAVHSSPSPVESPDA